MANKYEINNPKELQQLNLICNVYGIHFEKDIFDQVYVLIDHIAYFPEKQKYAKRKRRRDAQA